MRRRSAPAPRHAHPDGNRRYVDPECRPSRLGEGLHHSSRTTAEVDHRRLAAGTVHVRRLREKLERDPSDPKLVLTVGRFGYRMPREDELVAEDKPIDEGERP
jgi:hypothetical protein